MIADNVSKQARPSYCTGRLVGSLNAKDLLKLLLNNFATDLNSISSGFSGDKTK